MKIEFRDGLIFSSIEITYNGKSKVIDNMVIDTGAAKTLISADAVEDLGIKVEGNDELVVSSGIGGTEVSFVKAIDKIVLGDVSIINKRIDFSNMDYDDLNGLLGLDLLMDSGFIIDLKNLKIYKE